MLGLAQSNNEGLFDVENRLWPRPSDPNFSLKAGGGDPRLPGNTKIVRDYFLIMPSLKPFAARDSGLIEPGNPANPTIYTTPGDYLASSAQHPPAVYRFNVHYENEFTTDRGTIALGGLQLRRFSERVLVDGHPLTRDLDYRIDYE